MDGALAGCLFVAPLCFGGRHGLGQLIYGGLVATLTLAWVGRRKLCGETPLRWSLAHSLFLVAIAIVALQVIPLPPALVEKLSPAIADLAPTWTSSPESSIQLGSWQTLSMTPHASQIGLAVLMSHALLFVVVANRLRDAREIRRLLYTIGAAAAAMAAFGLVQWLASNGKLLWVYTHPHREIGETVQGAFANRNHFANFVVLGIGPLVFARRRLCAIRLGRRALEIEQRRLRLLRGAAAVGVIVAISAVLLSFSRGGFVALSVALAVIGLAIIREGQVGKKQLFSCAAIATAALLVVSFGDSARMFDRLDDLTSGSVEELDKSGGRREIWAANLAALKANPWFGYGVGSHADVYPAFFAGGYVTEFTHAESGYFHTGTETGLAGLAILFAAIVLLGAWCLKGLYRSNDTELAPLWTAVTAGLLASVVHSLVDFVWYIPACMSVTVLLAACACRLHQLSRQTSEATDPTPATANAFASAPTVCGAVAAMMIVASLWAPGWAALSWDRYLRASVRERRMVTAELNRPTQSPEATRAAIKVLKQQMIDALEETISRDPNHARAHMRLAGRLIQQFETSLSEAANAMSLTAIRDAALASNFPNRATTVDWLTRAFGEEAASLTRAHRHTLTGLQLAPLQGDGYGYLADLCFLAPLSQRDTNALMAQAMRIRPTDGGVLFVAGKQAFANGDGERGLALWQKSHEYPGSHRLLIMSHLTAGVSAREYLDSFPLDCKMLSQMYSTYRDHGDEDDLVAIAEYAKQLAEHTSADQPGLRQSAYAWSLTSRIHAQLDRPEEAVEYAKKSLDAMPNGYTGRVSLAGAFMAAGQFADAAPHIRWCLARQPGHKHLQVWLKQAQREQRVAQQPAPRTERIAR